MSFDMAKGMAQDMANNMARPSWTNGERRNNGS